MYDKFITDLLKDHASKNPDDELLICEDRHISCKDAYLYARSLAYSLLSKNLEIESIVAVFTKRSEYMVLGPLGVLMAGGAYMPLNEAYPFDRLNYILENSGASVLLTQRCMDLSGIKFNKSIIYLDDISFEAEDNKYGIKLPDINIHNAFSVFYTSGSTGNPKGCILEHGNVLNLCSWYSEYLGITNLDNIASHIGIGFDASMLDIFPAIINRCKLYIIREDIRLDIYKINEFFEENNITIACMTTQFGRLFAETANNKSLRALTVGGEKLSPFKKPRYRFINSYGPTECAVIATACEYYGTENSVSIGSEISGVSVYILDDSMNPVHNGEPGEVYIAGSSVGRGYIGEEALTNERFIDYLGQRVYKTGDIAIRFSDGSLDFIGRADSQIKLSGFRIELSEIESCINSYDKVIECAADVRNMNENQYICAYVRSKEGIDTNDLVLHIKNHLPLYMVPSIITLVDCLPVNQNGKIQRELLPDVSFSSIEKKTPVNSVQKTIFDTVASLLGHNNFGIDTNLYTSGMTSLNAVKLNVKLSQKFGIKILSSDIMNHPSVEELEFLVNSAPKALLVSHSRAECYSLTKNQLGVYVECLKYPDSVMYNLPFMYRFDNSIEPLRLKKAFEKSLDAHLFLKTYIRVDDGEPVMVKNDDYPVEIPIIYTDDNGIKTISDSFVKPFDLHNPLLFRIQIAVTKSAVYAFVDFHHIIFDGTSSEIFMRDTALAYEGSTISCETYTAFDASVWELSEEYKAMFKNDEKYFDDLLENYEWEYRIPYDKASVIAASHNTDSVSVFVDNSIVNKFTSLAGITPGALFLASLSYTAALYTGNENIVILTAVMGRNHQEYSECVGMFVKTLPVLCKVLFDKTAVGFCEDILQAIFGSVSHDSCHYSDFSHKHSISSEIMYVYQGDGFSDFTINDVKADSYMLFDEVKFNITMEVYKRLNSYEIKITYNKNLYSESYIKRFADALCITAKTIAVNPEIRLNSIQIISNADKNMLDSFNSTKVECEAETAVNLFKKQVNKSPDSIALKTIDKILTYKELDSISDNIAANLQAAGAIYGCSIGVVMGRSSLLLCVMLGIIKTGSRYIPIDCDYPVKRIEYVLNNSNAKYVITETDIQIKSCASPLLACDLTADRGFSFVPCDVKPDDGFCVIYTSGSTGQPKGVLLSNKGVCNYAMPLKHNFMVKEICEKCRTVISIGTTAFDISLSEILPALLNGLCLVFANESSVSSPALLADLIIKNKVDAFSCTPTRILAYMDDEKFRLALSYIKVILIAAEVFPISLFNSLRQLTSASIYNGYGPSETTIGAAFEKVENGSVSIGTPISNVKINILSKNKKKLPVGVIGELYISGYGVSMGYLNNADLTKEKFISFDGHKTYRTGDLARWNTNGKLEFFGRIDNQIKLNGLRIELEEIEKCISTFDSIIQCAVSLTDTKNAKMLCAYYVSEKDIDISELKNHLANTLIYYMIPNIYIKLDKMPLTVNGKINKKELPAPNIDSTKKYVPPTTETEKELCTIFENILGIDSVGVDDSFFELGGTSISAIKAAAKALALNIPITYSDIFKLETVRKLCAEKPDFFGSNAWDYNYFQIDNMLKANTADSIKTVPLGNIMLTGATGFLGIHVLKEFIENYQGNVYCLLRNKNNKPSEQRLKNMLYYYFEDNLSQMFEKRIFVCEGDISDYKSFEKLKDLPVDTFINCAADVRHFSFGDDMYKTNTDGVENIANYCLNNKIKFIQISTISVAGENINEEDKIFTEKSLYINQGLDNKYVYSKFKAERYVLEAIASKGLSAKIMRVGNLMARSYDGEFQINSLTNAYMNRLKSYIALGKCPISAIHEQVEYSPIDCTAKAILKLSELDDNYTVFHPYNNHLVSFKTVIEITNKLIKDKQVEIIDDIEFKKYLKNFVKNEDKSENITGLIVANENNKNAPTLADNSFTTKVLEKLGFSWFETNENYLMKVSTALFELGFFDDDMNASIF